MCTCLCVHECVSAFCLLSSKHDKHTGTDGTPMCVCVCVGRDVHVCVFECQTRQTPDLFVVAGVCVIFTGSLGKLTESRGLVLVHLVLFMGTDGVVALAQQQDDDAVSCSLLQQYHHGLPAAPWAESGDIKCTENCFLGAWLSLL